MKARIPADFKNLKKLRLRRSRKPSLGAMTAILLVAGGVAFALLQSQVKLTGNTIETVDAGLVISQDDTHYGPSTAGYDFSGIIPGAEDSQTEHFLVKNVGTAPLALKFGMASTPDSTSGVNLSKVHVILTPYDLDTFMPGTPQDFTMQSLIDAGSAGDGVAVDYPAMLDPGTKEEFNIRIAMDGDAVSGSDAALSNIDLAITGGAVSGTD